MCAAIAEGVEVLTEVRVEHLRLFSQQLSARERRLLEDGLRGAYGVSAEATVHPYYDREGGCYAALWVARASGGPG